MNLIDIILIILIASALAGAVYRCIKNKGTCRCSGCNGSCPHCDKCR